MRNRTTLLLGFLVAGALASFARDERQEPRKEQAASQADRKEPIEATLVALKGTVDVKRPEDKDWVAAERNMKLKKGAEICTAVASGATLLFTGNVKVEVKALTQARIEDLAKAGAKVNADVHLKFGSIEVDIQKGDLKADMKVTAPNSTTSVSGSQGVVRAYAQGGAGGQISLRCFTGSWRHESGGVSTGIEGGGAATNQGDLPRDLWYYLNVREFGDFGGRDGDELYRGRFGGRAGDFHASPWQFADEVQRGPASPKHRKPGLLPPPPRPPGP
jgi:hypothetical protein